MQRHAGLAQVDVLRPAAKRLAKRGVAAEQVSEIGERGSKAERLDGRGVNRLREKAAKIRVLRIDLLVVHPIRGKVSTLAAGVSGVNNHVAGEGAGNREVPAHSA